MPLVPPRCGIWARRHHAEMVLMNELWFAVVPPPSVPTSFLVLLPKASAVLSGAEALFDLSGRYEACEPDSVAHLRRDLEFVVREWCRSQGCPLAERVFKTVVGRKHPGGARKHPGQAPLVRRGGVIGASLEALGAEDHDLVEGF